MTQLQQAIKAKAGQIAELSAFAKQCGHGFDKSWGKGEFNKTGSPSPR